MSVGVIFSLIDFAGVRTGASTSATGDLRNAGKTAERVRGRRWEDDAGVSQHIHARQKGILGIAPVCVEDGDARGGGGCS